MIRENLEEKREEDRRKESLIFFVKILLACNFLYEVTTQFFQGGLNWTATKLERQMNLLNSEAYNKKNQHSRISNLGIKVNHVTIKRDWFDRRR